MKVAISVAGRFHAFNLAEQLERKGVLSCLYTQETRRKTDRIPAEKVVSSRFLTLIGLLEKMVSLVPFLRRFAGHLQLYKKKSHDIFVSREISRTDDIDIFVGWLGNCTRSLRVAKKKGIVTVIESGSTHPRWQHEMLKEEYWKTCRRRLSLPGYRKRYLRQVMKDISVCDHIAIPSKIVEKSFVANGISKDRLIRVPYGVNLTHFKQVKKKDSVFRVIFCGSLCVRKGLHYLIQAFNELDLPYSELMLIGHMDDDIAKFLSDNPNDKINFIGPRPHKTLYSFYSQGSVFVHPSIEEGLSLVQLEAMACGLPLIATTNTGAEDVIDDGVEGFIVPIRDVPALKRKIRYMYDNRDVCRKMGVNAKKRAGVFTWGSYGDKIVKFYSDCLKIRMASVSRRGKHLPKRRRDGV